MIDEREQAKLRAVPLCGERVVSRLEAIGITRLADLRGRDPEELVRRVNETAGYVIWRPPMATRAMANLVAAAEREASGTESQEPGDRLPEQLEGLVNLGPKLAEWLRAVGIGTPADLDAFGAVESYRRIKGTFLERVTLTALDALEGALLGINCLHLPEEIKDRLRAEAGLGEVGANQPRRTGKAMASRRLMQ